MKLLFIRHGDPDYTIDSLTEKGWKEAEFLSEKIAALDVRDFYVSPLGRAKDTASCTLKKNGRTATECKWLREFDVRSEDRIFMVKRSFPGTGFPRTGRRSKISTALTVGGIMTSCEREK